MNKADFYYKRNLTEIIEYGEWDENPRPKWKDGTPAHSKFITQVFEEYNIDRGEYPITTLRNTAIKMGINEILWIYQQQSNKLSDAHNLGIKWWDEWNVGDDTIGQRYGATVKRYDLLNGILTSLKDDPFSRRHIINMYQETDLKETKGLFPCAYETLWSVRKFEGDFYIDLTLIQRSNDYITAGYINKIQYVGLMMMVAGHLGYKVGKFCHLTQNLHVYDRHFDAVTEILTRRSSREVPVLSLKENKNFYDYSIDDFIIDGIGGIMKLNTKLEIAV
jgi:thymidylate synthase